MTVTKNDIYGDRDAPQAAEPGSYGMAPRGFRLPDTTRLGGVRLQVADLTRSLDFYQRLLGLRVTSHDGRRASLAAHDDPRELVVLEEQRGIRPSRRGLLGLYHFAILLPDRAALGRFVQHLADENVRAGAGDHLVSEAFYLTDPDGLGIEVYADRPRDEWRRIGRELMLATDPVDASSLVAAAAGEPWRGMPAGTMIGHVHLHVGNLEDATAFYADGMGFDRMTWSYPGALFLGAGGYHHHLGTNLWAGPHARRPEAEDARLLEWTVEVPSASDVHAVAASVASAGYDAQESEDSALLVDPWGTRVRVVVG